MRAPDLLLRPFDLVQYTLSIHSLIYHAGFVSSTFVIDNEGFTLDELDSLTPNDLGTHGDPDVLGIHS